jgi:cytochrome c
MRLRLAPLAALLVATVPVIAQEPAAAGACDAAPGKKLFEQCLSCHSLDASGKSMNAGPNLNGVIGRKAGTLPGYSFSQALKTSGITWTESDLLDFIAKPPKKVPGTVMMFIGMKNPADRAALMCYLRTAGAAPSG